jgi:GNAT superfamily N-acetyltransferase
MCSSAARKLTPDSALISEVLRLVQETFAYMAPRINPPSSMYRLTERDIVQACTEGDVWIIGDKPEACVFLKPKGAYLYLGKLAVSPRMRGTGLARRLIEIAQQRAQELGLSGLELETRVELTENHATFQHLGFTKQGEGAHAGFDRPTYIIMRKAL